MKRSRATKKQVSPWVAVIVIVAVLAVCGAIGWKLMAPERRTIEAPAMSPEVRKQRQAESMAWGEEMKRAKLEHRLPDYSKLPRTGHAGGGMPMTPAGQ